MTPTTRMPSELEVVATDFKVLTNGPNCKEGNRVLSSPLKNIPAYRKLLKTVQTMGRGALIVLEGCDRAGKSTQVKMLVQSLREQGIPTEACQFPNRGTEIGAVINEYLTSKKDYPPETIHLLFAANRWECKGKIERLLRNGTTVIVDRYAASGAAYGAANTGRDLAWCKNPDKGLLAPDLVAYLRIDAETQKLQCGWAEERYEKADFQKKVAQNFAKLSDETWKIIERGDVRKTHLTILEAVINTVRAVNDRPLKELYES